MSKIRVYELARELKIESKLLVNKLKDLGIEVSSHQSTLSADQVVKIKRELSSSGAAAASPAGESSAASAPRTSPSVIRRRRGAEETEDQGTSQEDEGAPQSAEASPAKESAAQATPKTTTIRREKAKEPEAAKEKPVETQAQTPAPAPEAVQTQATPKTEAPAQESAKVEQTAKTEAAPAPAASAPEAKEPQAAREAPRTASSPVSEPKTTMSRPQAQENYDSAKIVRREPVSQQSAPAASPQATASAAPRPQPSGAATIIRRASPEEIEQRQAMARDSQAARSTGGSGAIIRPNVGGVPQGFPSGGGPIRREGGAPRPEGGRPAFGGGAPRGGAGGEPLYSRKPPALDTEAPTGLTDSPQRRWEDRSKDRDKRKLTAAEAEIEAAAAAKKREKIRRDQINMRSLLDQAATLEEEENFPGEPEAPEAIVPQKKTVYTPPGQAGSYRSSGSSRRDLKRRKDLKKTEVTTPRAAYRVVKMANSITIADLAKQMSVKGSEIIKKLMSQGMMATLNQAIDVDTATLVATEFGFEMKSSVVTLDDILTEKRKAYEGAEFVERSPIVTIMGHVDHGKTSILDAIRSAKVAAGEAGGITQHIGAYTVEKDGKKIAFLDTPGHEAFSSMRSRGAKVTDIVILVVAADDGVMPQTVEAISHARAANVPIIVAINKIDKPNKNLDRINSELAEHGIQSEEWGGDNQFVQVSALKKIGIDDLLEAILLQAEVLELRTPLDVPASGSVVEAHLDKGRGPVATIMVQKGVLKVGDYVVAGTSLGRVRAMHDQTGRRVKEAGPSTPVEVVGLASVPMAGDAVDAVESEAQGKEVADWRIETERLSSSTRSSAATLDQLLAKVKNTDTPEVPIIIKADTQGSLEAISEAVLKLNSDRVRNRIVHKAVGGVNESDLSLAQTSGAVVIGFNVRAIRGLDEQAEKQGTLVKYFSVIYDIVDVLKSIMAGKLPPIQKEVIQGHAEVRATIKVPKVGLVAGTSVLDGKITRNSQLRLIRESVVVFTGRIGSLRRFKDDVREVVQGYECGIGIDGYSDVREGDIIESFIIEEHAAVL